VQRRHLRARDATPLAPAASSPASSPPSYSQPPAFVHFTTSFSGLKSQLECRRVNFINNPTNQDEIPKPSPEGSQSLTFSSLASSHDRLTKMSEERLWKFQRPEWMNSAYIRSAGVYTAGGLVRFLFLFLLPSRVYPFQIHNPRYDHMPPGGSPSAFRTRWNVQSAQRKQR
jgi:hypothetical protein